MNKEELKQYLSVAIDALSEEELASFSLKFSEPDLLSIGNEISSLNGEVKKMNTVSLKLSNQIHTLFEQNTQKIDDNVNLDDKIKQLLLKIIEQDELINRTKQHFDKLPEMKYFFNFKFKKYFYAWKEGFFIQNEKWTQFLRSIDLKKTGKVGELFNPNFHEAVETISDTNQKDNHITDSEEVGYLYKNILLKRAKVTVNKI